MSTFGTTSTSRLLHCESSQMGPLPFHHDTHYFYVRVFSCYSIFHLFSILAVLCQASGRGIINVLLSFSCLITSHGEFAFREPRFVCGRTNPVVQLCPCFSRELMIVRTHLADVPLPPHRRANRLVLLLSFQASPSQCPS